MRVAVYPETFKQLKNFCNCLNRNNALVPHLPQPHCYVVVKEIQPVYEVPLLFCLI